MTLASTGTYMQPPAVTTDESLSSTRNVSPSISPASATSGTGRHVMGVSGTAAAGTGVGAVAGSLGFGIVVVYRHRRRPRINCLEFNQLPVKHLLTQQPSKMCAETEPQKKDASNRSEIVGVGRWWALIQRGRKYCFFEVLQQIKSPNSYHQCFFVSSIPHEFYYTIELSSSHGTRY
ncbi:hypothetical protein F5Y19DRAFT_413661 [Xylariaceae sp. FL1651]|nr:hypothetical protein F5Y19DRAFT_413661 [Xylariaceae sp. FL1651]